MFVADNLTQPPDSPTIAAVGTCVYTEQAGDGWGGKVSISADGTRFCGAAWGNHAGGFRRGHVRVFEYDGATWNQLGQSIGGESDRDRSSSCAISGDGKRLVTLPVASFSFSSFPGEC